MVLAFRCCRRRRELWLTTKRVTRMWAAKFSSRCSEEGFSHVTYRQTACDGALGRHRDRRGTDRQDEGAEGPASVRRARRRRGEVRKRCGQGKPAVRDQPRAGALW